MNKACICEPEGVEELASFWLGRSERFYWFVNKLKDIPKPLIMTVQVEGVFLHPHQRLSSLL